VISLVLWSLTCILIGVVLALLAMLPILSTAIVLRVVRCRPGHVRLRIHLFPGVAPTLARIAECSGVSRGDAVMIVAAFVKAFLDPGRPTDLDDRGAAVLESVLKVVEFPDGGDGDDFGVTIGGDDDDDDEGVELTFGVEVIG
jgi:hypothetical protein